MIDRPLTRRRLLARTAAASLAAGAGGLVTACGNAEDEDPGSLDRARRVGHLRLGIANERPFGYFDGARLTGLGPALAGRIAAGLGIPEVFGVVTEFGGLLSGLRAGTFDVVAAGIYVAPDRCRKVAFGAPFYCTTSALAVRRGESRRLRDLKDVAGTRRARLGVLAGSLEIADARAAGVPAARLTELPDVASLSDALASGAVDAAVLTSVSIRRLVFESAGRLRAMEPFVAASAPRCGAFAFRPENGRLREGFDRQLRGLQRSGAAVRIGRGFGFSSAEMLSARDRRPADLCAAPER